LDPDIVAEHTNIRCAANVRSFKELAWIDGNAGEINILAFFLGSLDWASTGKNPLAQRLIHI
jgi:hypothetical protein